MTVILVIVSIVIYIYGNSENAFLQPSTVCGDGIVSGNEQCDDGDVANGDGCSVSCNIESGYECGGEPSVCNSAELNLVFEKKISGVTQPVDIVNADDGSDRLFIVERGGKIKIFKNGNSQGTFLDVVGKITTNGGEQGLLGLAFHPDYENNGKFYISYTRTDGDSVIAEYMVSGDPDVGNLLSERVLLTVDQPFNNHNGGHILFGKDGYLYIAFGDGGGIGDPLGNGQNINNLLAAILRIDVNSKDPGLEYGIPNDNPFVGVDGRDEIFAYGLRNPWEISVDRENGRIFAGDVGQSRIEEVDIIEKGKNYGWKIMEGTECFQSTNCDQTGLTLPIIEYMHSVGCSVTGGNVYRGDQYQNMKGLYIYGDFCAGRVWAIEEVNGVWMIEKFKDTTFAITAFGEDESGEIYLADYNNGDIYLVKDSNSPTQICGNNIVEGSEKCDDGNLLNNDGCSSICKSEIVQQEEICGDGIKIGNEQCDDGNLINGDGCSSTCQNEQSEEDTTDDGDSDDSDGTDEEEDTDEEDEEDSTDEDSSDESGSQTKTEKSLPKIISSESVEEKEEKKLGIWWMIVLGIIVLEIIAVLFIVIKMKRQRLINSIKNVGASYYNH